MSFTDRNVSVVGFQFEPERPLNEQQTPSYDDDEPELPTASRLHIEVSEWCLCEMCEVMLSDVECLCCHEVDTIKYFQLRDKKCITEHEDFHAVVMLKNTLWTALVSLHDRESRGLPKRDDVSNKSYRYAAYRQFCWFVHNHLGRGVRRVIPSCVVAKIRREYPSADGLYTGFKEGQEIPEIDYSWVNEVEDE